MPRIEMLHTTTTALSDTDRLLPDLSSPLLGHPGAVARMKRLLPLPDNPAPLIEHVAVTVGKTRYVRFGRVFDDRLRCRTPTS